MVGKTLSHYEILAPLGAGGMGEVYRARDTKLERDVAIKVLPDDLAADPVRLARFEREAKLLASLNHANIAAVYGLEDEGGQRFIAMELIEGESLAERLARDGRLQVEDALEIARQIAGALGAAHEGGIVHRDLKPANVMLARGTDVKVLDFGLAKALTVDDASALTSLGKSEAPTRHIDTTTTGVIMGTASYMSPEQAAGGPIDKRTDIWSFGVVLFEMLAGRKPFRGDSAGQVIAEVIKTDLDLSELPSDTPPGIRRLLRRCLSKKPDRRLHDIADARIEIDEALDPATGSSDVAQGKPESGPAPAARHAALPWAIAALATIAAVLLGVWGARPAPQEPLRTFEIVGDGLGVDMSISPDGSKLAYWGHGPEPAQPVLVHDLETAVSRTVYTTEGPRGVFSPGVRWSPDGSQLVIAYGGEMPPSFDFSAVEMRIVVIPVAGGAPRVVHEGLGSDPNFMADGSVVFETPDGVAVVSLAGDEPHPILANQERDERRPIGVTEPLPDGTLLYFESGEPPSLHHFNGRESRLVREMPANWRRVSRVSYADGFLLMQASTEDDSDLPGDFLWVTTFDLATATVEGEPFRLGPRVSFHTVSDDGTLLYVTETPAAPADFEVVRVSRAGVITETLARRNGERIGDPRLSPDGTRLALTAFGEDGPDVWIYEVETGGAPLRLPGRSFVGWLPDGERLAIKKDREGGEGAVIALEGAQGAGESRDLIAASWCSISPDGRHIVYKPELIGDTLRVEIGEDGSIGEPVPFPLEIGLGAVPGWISPNSRWMAYDERRQVPAGAETQDVWVASFPDGGSARVVAPGRGVQWSHDGQELFFVANVGGERLMMVVPFDPERGVTTGPEQRLFSLSGLDDRLMYEDYGVAPDGESFVMLRPLGDVLPLPQRSVILKQNWMREIENIRGGTAR